MRHAVLIALVSLGACRSFELTPQGSAQAPPGTLAGGLVAGVAGTNGTRPAKGALLQLLENISTISRDDGTFTLEGIATVDGKLLIQLDEDGDGTFERQKLLALSDVGAGPGRNVVLPDLALRENASVSGRVRLADKATQKSGLYLSYSESCAAGTFTIVVRQLY